MSKLRTVSINLSKLREIYKLNPNHSAFFKRNNGDICFNVAIWDKDEPDQYFNDVSAQLCSKKEMRESEGKIYLGDGKKFVQNSGTPSLPAAPKQSNPESKDDFPF